MNRKRKEGLSTQGGWERTSPELEATSSIKKKGLRNHIQEITYPKGIYLSTQHLTPSSRRRITERRKSNKVHPSIQRLDLPTIMKRIIKHLLREAKPRSRTLIAIPKRRHFDRRVRDLDGRQIERVPFVKHILCARLDFQCCRGVRECRFWK